LTDFYQFFYRRGFFDLKGLLAGDVLDVEPPEDHLVGPLAVHLEVIAACNLSCCHCFAGELPRSPDPLTLLEMESLFQELAGMGSMRLGVTGGEPLMRADILDILDTATQAGLHPCLTTNATLMTKDLARELGRRELVWLNVSLDGATAKSNDAVRGAGCFARVMRGIENLRTHARFSLAFTITRHNADEVEQCAHLARSVGASAAVFRPLYPVGKAGDHPALMPTFDQYTDAIRRLSGALTSGVDLQSTDPFSPTTRIETEARTYKSGGCGAANLVASISAHGDVNPCSFLGSVHNSGNIREQSFSEIWHHGEAFDRLRKLPSSRADAMNRFCGGCRARAQALNGDWNDSDPWFAEFMSTMHRRNPMSNVEVCR
jgi:radical SAM protein with 4Fe4S-binding SPASM domain